MATELTVKICCFVSKNNEIYFIVITRGIFIARSLTSSFALFDLERWPIRVPVRLTAWHSSGAMFVASVLLVPAMSSTRRTVPAHNR